MHSDRPETVDLCFKDTRWCARVTGRVGLFNENRAVELGEIICGNVLILFELVLQIDVEAIFVTVQRLQDCVASLIG